MTTSGVANQASARPGAEVQELFHRIADSETFRTAQVTRTLLLYLWEHQGEPVSEYALAVEAMGRAADFDPRADATVRVQIARLRGKLKEFYETEGRFFPLQLVVPLGTHELQWTHARKDALRASKLGVWAENHSVALLGAAVASTLAVIALAVLFQVRTSPASPVRPSPAPKFWQSFLADGKPAGIIVPDVTAFQYPGLTVMEPSTPNFNDWANSLRLLELSKKLGPPSLNQVYTPARHAIAGFDMLQFLEKQGKDVRLVESADLGGDAAAHLDTIFLGGNTTVAHISELLKNTNFTLERSSFPSVIRNRSPKAGEPREYQEATLSSERKICPGIIVWLPARPEGTRSVVLAGRWTTALATLLISSEGQRLLQSELSKIGSPEAWQAVVQAEIQADTTILKVWPVAVRELNAKYWE